MDAQARGCLGLCWLSRLGKGAGGKQGALTVLQCSPTAEATVPRA